jgi:hypothetical protein
MSGRVRVTLKDGRRVTGFRKTERVNSRPKAVRVQPELCLSFQALPRFLLAPAPTGVLGVNVKDPGPRITVTGRNRGWLFKQLRIFLDQIGAPAFSALVTLGEAEKLLTAKSYLLEYDPLGGIIFNGKAVA